MSKQISAKELGEIVTKLLVNPHELGDASVFQCFMTDIAAVCCRYCGGQINALADADFEGTWLIGISDDGALPTTGDSIWSKYDPEGEL